MSPLAALAFLLLLVGVVGCLLPRLPGVTASLAGVYLYWWTTGFSEPTALVVGVLTLVGGLAALSSVVADAVSARISDASPTTLLIAGAVGTALLVLTGPIGMILGTALTAFLLEYRRRRTVSAGARAALAVVASSVGSRLFRFALAVVILVTMVVVVLL